MNFKHDNVYEITILPRTCYIICRLWLDYHKVLFSFIGIKASLFYIRSKQEIKHFFTLNVNLPHYAKTFKQPFHTPFFHKSTSLWIYPLIYKAPNTSYHSPINPRNYFNIFKFSLYKNGP
jgi:hypothetical protein